MFLRFDRDSDAEPIREHVIFILAKALALSVFLTLFFGWSPAQTGRCEKLVGDQTNQQLVLQFSRQSASQLVAHYFQGPQYPLFVIHRLIDLADSSVSPALQDAFSHETQPITRQALAAALVRLRDPDPQYFAYLAASAQSAASSDLPYSCEIASGRTQYEESEFPLELVVWAQAHNLSLSNTLRRAAIELPAAVEALGEAADPRALAILLLGLNSPNTCTVRTSAFGLARLHDPVAVEPIIRACSKLSTAERPLTAKALFYFGTYRAQQAAKSIIADTTLMRSWRIEAKHRGWKSAMRDRAIP
jgi:HEAT repeat protein